MQTMRAQSFSYRPDVDGLRAVAVLSVLAFHAYPAILPGGYIGVDIFFVISGFLIGSLILHDLEAGRFTFTNFYVRRIRRIFPALLTVLCTAMLLGLATFHPDEYAMLGKHIFGGGAFIDNIFFTYESGYFDIESKAKPLLHFWSLGVEEQFYLLTPLILFLAYRRNRVLPCVVIILCASYAAAICLSVNPVFSYYSLLTRAWELFAGVLLAHATANGLVKTHGALGIAGLTLLAINLAVLEKNAPVPLFASLTVPAAAGILLAGQNSWTAKLLSARPLVFIGKISYPLYLWHWLLLGWSYVVRRDTDPPLMLTLAFLFAMATYFLIENPVRFKKKVATGTLAGLMCLVSGLGLFIFLTDGCAFRSPFAGMLAEELAPYATEDEPVRARYPEIPQDKNIYARLTDIGAKETLAIMGDSHAISLFYGASAMARDIGKNILLLARPASTYPLLSLLFPDTNPKRLLSQKLFSIVGNHGEITDVLLVARGPWSYDFCMGEKEFAKLAKRLSYEDIFRESMQAAIDCLYARGKRIAVLQDTPELPDDIRAYIPRPFQTDYRETGQTRSSVTEAVRSYNGRLSELKNVKILWTTGHMCPVNGPCLLHTEDGRPLYKDNNHLSFSGSRYLVGKLLPDLTSPPRSLP